MTNTKDADGQPFAPLTGSAATWQPIETAPKDGASILLYDGQTRVGYWGG